MTRLTAFVTGASGGIGREIALALADEGWRVAVAARGDGIHETADRIDGDAFPVRCDVTDEESVADAIDATVSEFGGLDCLVNNAGIAGPTKPVEDVTDGEFADTLDVNLVGAFRTVKHAAPHLRASDRGSVVNIASISGKRPLTERTPYVASKMGVVGLTRTLAFELGDDDVTVNAVSPGPVAGDRIERVIQNQADARDISYEEAKEAVFTDDAALGELVDPEDVANTVTFLASEKARHVTAQDVTVDAGTTWY